MSQNIKAQMRENSSKGAVRQIRRDGDIPAVVYGAGKEPESVSVNGHDILLTMQRGGFFTTKHTLEFANGTQEVLARDIQRHPVSDKVLHIDFLRYDPNRTLKIMVAVKVKDQELSPGIKIGGVLQLVRPEVELLCRADSIPSHIEISMAGKGIGDAVKISEATLPEGVTPSVDRDFTVASIVSTRTSTLTEKSDDEEGEGEEGTEAAE